MINRIYRIGFLLLFQLVWQPFGTMAQTNPQKPVITNIVVSPAGEVEIIWTIDDISDITGFDILRWENPAFLLVESIPFDPANPDMSYTYTPNNYNPCQERAIYSVRPVIPGINTTQSEAFSTILLEIEDYQVCDRISILTWSALSTTYQDTDDENSRYKIYAESVENPGFQLIADFESSSLTPVRDESYYQTGLLRINYYSTAHTGLIPGNTYRYYVEASNDVEGWTSVSCIQEITAEYYPTPDFYNLLSVSVTPTNRVELTIEIDLGVFLEDVLVFRSQQSPMNLEALGEFPMPSTMFAILFDSTARSGETSYYYQFGVNDSCNYELRGSNIHRTIHLSGELLSVDEPTLSWNAYEGWDVYNYHIYRRLANESNFQLIDSVAESVRNYSDNISQLDDQTKSGEISYYVRAIADTATLNGTGLFSNSNIFHFAFESDPIVSHNAFNPTSSDINNAQFKPLGLYFGPNRPYLFQIFNRWGELVFESIDYNVGWDGRYKGVLVPRGVYVFLLNYTDIEGLEVNERGTVMVIY